MPFTLVSVTPDLVQRAFPHTKRANIAANLPHVLEGLRARGLVDRQMVMMALATIAAETAQFVPIDEGKSRWNTSPGGVPFGLYDAGTVKGADLGNTEPGDGLRFRGRGFVQLTGRWNYAETAKLVDRDLVAEPELANHPAVAGQILAAFLAKRAPKIRAALEAGDLARARRLVNGGSHGLDEFTACWRRLDQLLPKD